MTIFTTLFLAAIAGALALRAWLARRQVTHVRAHRAAVPAAFADCVPLPAHQAAADYAIAKVRFTVAAAGGEAILLLGWTLGGGLGLLDRAWSAAGLSPLGAGTGLVTSTLLLGALLRLPMNAGQRFVVDGRFGLNRVTPRLFLADAIRSLALLAAVAAPPAALAIWLMINMGQRWWFGLWVLWTAVSVARFWLHPVLVTPLFNRLQPLPDGSLRRRIEALLKRCGIPPCEILVIDGSRRSAQGNASFTGIGATRRILLQDTLMRSLAADEIEAVVAHEAGHLAHRHFGRYLAMNAAIGLAVLALLGWLAAQPGFRAGVGLDGTSSATLLAWALLALPPLEIYLRPLPAAARRRFEVEADRYAAQHADPDSLIRALVKLFRGNAETLTPSPFHVAFFHTHPPPAARLDRLRRLATSPAGAYAADPHSRNKG